MEDAVSDLVFGKQAGAAPDRESKSQEPDVVHLAAAMMNDASSILDGQVLKFELVLYFVPYLLAACLVILVTPFSIAWPIMCWIAVTWTNYQYKRAARNHFNILGLIDTSVRTRAKTYLKNPRQYFEEAICARGLYIHNYWSPAGPGDTLSASRVAHQKLCDNPVYKELGRDAQVSAVALQAVSDYMNGK